MSTTTSTTAAATKPRHALEALRATPPQLKMVLGRTKTEMREYFGRWETVFFIFLFPTLMFSLFSSVFANSITGEINAAQYLLPAMLSQGFMASSFQVIAMGITNERENGILKRLRATPMNAAVYISAKVNAMLLGVLASSALLLCVGKLFYDVELPDSSGWITLGWVFVLSVTCGTLQGIAISTVLRDSQAANAIVTPIGILLPFISGVYFQWSALPTALKTVASVFPLRWQTQGARSAFLAESFAQNEGLENWQLGTAALVLIVWIVAMALVSYRRFSWSQYGED